MTVESPDKYVMGSITSLPTFNITYITRIMDRANRSNNAPAVVPERQPCDGAPVDREHAEPRSSHPPRAAVRLFIAVALERLHLRELCVDGVEPAAQKTRAVRDGGDFHVEYNFRSPCVICIRVVVGNADGELRMARGVADEVADVGGVRPLERLARGGRTAEGYGRCGGRHRREDESANMR